MSLVHFQNLKVVVFDNYVQFYHCFSRRGFTELLTKPFQKLPLLTHLKCTLRDFPGGAMVKNPPANAGTMGSIPGPGRFPMPRSN